MIVLGEFGLESIRQRVKPINSVDSAYRLGLPVAAVSVMVDPDQIGGAILFIKRVERQGDPWSSQIAFPGGRRQAADSSYLETAIRETVEEVGVDLSNHELLGVLPFVTARSRKIVVVPFVFRLKEQVALSLNPEVAKAFWISFGELQGFTSRKSEVLVDEGRITVDSYLHDGEVVWGLTYRIVNLLLARESP